MPSATADIRAFIAVNPPEEVRRCAGLLIAAGREALPGVRWVRAGQVHLTVKFLGAVPGERVDAVRRRLRETCASASAFPAVLGGLRAFPEERRPRVIALGALLGRDELVKLMARVEQDMTLLNFPPEGRAPDPHLTLGRCRAPLPPAAWKSWRESNRGAELGRFAVSELSLMKSVLGPGGPRYEVIEEFPLAPPTAAPLGGAA